MNKPLTISLVQSALHWENKKANLKLLEEKIFSIKEKTELIVLPEMFSTGFTMQAKELAEAMDGPTVEWMKRIASERKIVLTGSIIIKEGQHYFNRLIWMLPSGEYGIYDKRHRFGYAGEDQHYDAGNKRFIASVKGWKVNLQICYDLRFPVWSRQQVKAKESLDEDIEAEYDVLIYVANWPEKRSQVWKTLLMARAIENQCYVVGVNRVGKDGNDISYNGDSMIIDPLGEVLCTGINDSVYTLTLQKEHLEAVRKRFPFLKDADQFQINL